MFEATGIDIHKQKEIQLRRLFLTPLKEKTVIQSSELGTRKWVIKDVSDKSLTLSELGEYLCVEDIYPGVVHQERRAMRELPETERKSMREKFQDEVDKIMQDNDAFDTKDEKNKDKIRTHLDPRKRTA